MHSNRRFSKPLEVSVLQFSIFMPRSGQGRCGGVTPPQLAQLGTLIFFAPFSAVAYEGDTPSPGSPIAINDGHTKPVPFSPTAFNKRTRLLLGVAEKAECHGRKSPPPPPSPFCPPLEGAGGCHGCVPPIELVPEALGGWKIAPRGGGVV